MATDAKLVEGGQAGAKIEKRRDEYPAAQAGERAPEAEQKTERAANPRYRDFRGAGGGEPEDREAQEVTGMAAAKALLSGGTGAVGALLAVVVLVGAVVLGLTDKIDSRAALAFGLLAAARLL